METPAVDEPFVSIDGRDFTLGEFKTMVSTFAGWGMRIEFVPDDETDKRPRLKVREPDPKRIQMPDMRSFMLKHRGDRFSIESINEPRRDDSPRTEETDCSGERIITRQKRSQRSGPSARGYHHVRCNCDEHNREESLVAFIGFSKRPS